MPVNRMAGVDVLDPIYVPVDAVVDVHVEPQASRPQVVDAVHGALARPVLVRPPATSASRSASARCSPPCTPSRASPTWCCGGSSGAAARPRTPAASPTCRSPSTSSPTTARWSSTRSEGCDDATSPSCSTQSLPGLYRDEDEHGELRAFLELTALPLDELETSIAQLHEDLFVVGTCRPELLTLLGAWWAPRSTRACRAARSATRCATRSGFYRSKGLGDPLQAFAESVDRLAGRARRLLRARGAVRRSWRRSTRSRPCASGRSPRRRRAAGSSASAPTAPTGPLFDAAARPGDHARGARRRRPRPTPASRTASRSPSAATTSSPAGRAHGAGRRPDGLRAAAHAGGAPLAIPSTAVAVDPRSAASSLGEPPPLAGNLRVDLPRAGRRLDPAADARRARPADRGAARTQRRPRPLHARPARPAPRDRPHRAPALRQPRPVLHARGRVREPAAERAAARHARAGASRSTTGRWRWATPRASRCSCSTGSTARRLRAGGSPAPRGRSRSARGSPTASPLRRSAARRRRPDATSRATRRRRRPLALTADVAVDPQLGRFLLDLDGARRADEVRVDYLLASAPRGRRAGRGAAADLVRLRARRRAVRLARRLRRHADRRGAAARRTAHPLPRHAARLDRAPRRRGRQRRRSPAVVLDLGDVEHARARRPPRRRPGARALPLPARRRSRPAIASTISLRLRGRRRRGAAVRAPRPASAARACPPASSPVIVDARARRHAVRTEPT